MRPGALTEDRNPPANSGDRGTLSPPTDSECFGASLMFSRMSPARESDDQRHSLHDASGAARPSREELIGQIRFALSELASDNGQHRFEDLCRHFARERLVPNILPATGPVGVGGDQGRDFETFRSYLRDELGTHGAFAGRLQQGHVAFACTLQQDGLPSKIRQDIKKITGSGSQVVAIYVFLVAPLPVATRHK